MIEGRLVGGRYLLLDTLERRGFGPSHRAEDRITGRTVVVTEITLPADDGARERLLAEVRAAGRLRHPGVVGVLDLITDRVADGGMREYLVTEHPETRPLSRVLTDGDPPSPRRAAVIGRDVLAALRAVHAEGRTHGGLDPDCVLLAPDGRGLVTDIGLARAIGRRATGGSPFTPPERTGPDGDTPAADLWSLGAVLHHAAGRQAAPGSPLDQAITGLTAAEPAGRIGPDHAEALLERAARPRPTGGDLGRNRWILLLAAGVLLVAVVGMVLWAVL
ncbi:Protein kinase domain-containing protein [Pseudonocardia ammonioxydans]|uniref:non-specific serine/threonine protein kinase n=1 Tax=Pseudonocardia ammonioxydans TaxID=260086 RepID=A0A1I4W9U6_PSUAM|nr:protein kinase [Pseudonocardia ammonioxydans]SFN10461.1 Protein kinase domain-containing protein [Pseudonocardia ammonioxydans]